MMNLKTLIRLKQYECELKNKNVESRYLEPLSEVKYNYLKNYNNVIQLLNMGITYKKIEILTGVSFITICKVSTQLRYGDPKIKINPYLQKYSDVVHYLIKGFSQRKAALITGVSLVTVNQVAKIVEVYYYEMYKQNINSNEIERNIVNVSKK